MRVTTLIAAIVLPTLVFAAPVPKDKEKAKDETAILGTWKIEKFDTGGGPNGPPPGEVEKIQFVFEVDSVLRIAGGPRGEQMKGSFKIDPLAKIKTIDMTMTSPGGGKLETMLGLYELDGDTLKLCITNGPGSPRPTDLKADGKGVALVTLKRVTEEKKDQ
ncbi:MAG: TIGR03067 domain-containing protein [Fimbriiglobus sp.]|jgi:uncharacterized protein (TIGR03067 family)|nr:TIGR03067 domain-containing protein [Fimbriiglobus sp.]